MFVEVTRSNLGSLKEALRDGPTEPLRRYELLHVNGTSLELLATPQGDAVLVVLPHEHLSHVLWSQLNEAGRLQLLLGFHAVFGVLAALLGRRPPRIDNLLTAVKAKTLKPTGIVAGSGAYMEACMRSKLFVFIAVHGETEGRARWLAWYTECKTRAGEVLLLRVFVFLMILPLGCCCRCLADGAGKKGGKERSGWLRCRNFFVVYVSLVSLIVCFSLLFC